MAPCATSAIAARRVWRISASDSVSRSLPDRLISPPSILPGGLIMRRMARPVVDLPEPDSPTSPTRSAGLMSRLTPSTAFTGPRLVW